MNREACKFFSGAFAALGYAHAAYAIATSRGVISEPVFLGRRWGVGFMWTEAAIYSGLSLALGYAGWGGASQEPPGQAIAEPAAQVAESHPVG